MSCKVDSFAHASENVQKSRIARFQSVLQVERKMVRQCFSKCDQGQNVQGHKHTSKQAALFLKEAALQMLLTTSRLKHHCLHSQQPLLTPYRAECSHLSLHQGEAH